MNPTLDSTTLVTAMLWLLALALPLAMLLWMAAQFVALRSLGRRVRALEGAATTDTAPATLLEDAATTDTASATLPDEDLAASEAAEGHA